MNSKIYIVYIAEPEPSLKALELPPTEERPYNSYDKANFFTEKTHIPISAARLNFPVFADTPQEAIDR